MMKMMNKKFEFMTGEGYTVYHQIMNDVQFFAGLYAVMYGEEETVSKDEALEAVRLWTDSDEVVGLADQFMKEEGTRISLWLDDVEETLEITEGWDTDMSHHLLIWRNGEVAVEAGFRNYVTIR